MCCVCRAAVTNSHASAEAELVGYLADGQALTLEECNFLQSNLPAKPAALDDDIL